MIVGQRVTPEMKQTASFLGSKGIDVTCVEFTFFKAAEGGRLLSQEIVVGGERRSRPVVRAGPFVTAMQPVVLGDDELLTGIVGVLTDAETGDVLSGVTVRTGRGRTGTFTDTRGEFLFDDLIPGQHVLGRPPALAQHDADG